ncbi:S-methyl thiohydantoin desulfurase domain-containing protein [Xanthobacter autotrophicus]|uniref:S-methyl thiohydantoin desulfurase domain-containing protein n=2 Tax=Xanthobacter autotrophicus TaxID=280 RepID=UPI00372D482E
MAGGTTDGFTGERPPMPRMLDADELDLLAIGAWILGTGGGGSPYASHLVVRHFYEDGGRLALLDPDELADADVVAVISTMGAPLVRPALMR